VLAAVLAACGHDDLQEPADVREYHGEPSRVVCGQRWSLDRRSLVCNQRLFFALEELRPFSLLEGLTLENAALITDGAPFPGIRNLQLSRARLLDARSLRWFPSTTELAIDETLVDYATLAELDRLRYLSLWKVSPPAASQLAAIPSLESVDLVHLRCPHKGCAMALARELHALRPTVTIRVDGIELRW